MKKLLLVLAVAALAVPAFAGSGNVYNGNVFKVKQDGSFASFRGSPAGTDGEGYTNGGETGFNRLAKGNQHYGWFTFNGSVDKMHPGTTLAAYLAANPTATMTLYVRMNQEWLPQVTPTAADSGPPANAILVSIRCGNTGQMGTDLGRTISGSYPSYNFLPLYRAGDPNFVSSYFGAAELQAWKGCSDNGNGGFAAWGDGIYYNNNPVGNTALQGEPWIAPSGRVAPFGMNALTFAAGAAIQYDTGLIAGLPATSLYRGFYSNMPTGPNTDIYAFEDLLGFWANRSSGHTFASIASAGQIIMMNPANPTLPYQISALNFNLSDKGDAYQHPTPDEWYEIPMTNAFVLDMINNAQNKGFVFDTAYEGNPAFYTNPGFWEVDQAGTTGAPATYAGETGAYLWVTMPGQQTVAITNTQPITVAAGTLALTTSATNATGCDYHWERVTGPTGGVCSFSTNGNPLSGNPTASFDTVGTYVVRVVLLNATTLVEAFDTVVVDVTGLAPVNVAPLANAGVDKAITLPTSSVALSDATASDPDSGPSPLTYLWTQVSGPAVVGFSPSGTVLNPTATGMTAAGTYVLQLAAFDGAATTTDTVSIVVSNPAPPVINSITPSPVTGTGTGGRGATFYLLPPVLAIPPLTNDLTLTPSITLGGVATPTYSWTKVSGAIPVVTTPVVINFGTGTGTNAAMVSFATASAASTTVRFSRNGTYVLQLSVNDGYNAPVTMSVTIRVTSCDVDASGGNVNSTDRTKMTNAFGNQNNIWMDLDGSGGNVNSTDRTKMTNAFGKSAVQTAYPSDTPFH